MVVIGQAGLEARRSIPLQQEQRHMQPLVLDVLGLQHLDVMLGQIFILMTQHLEEFVLFRQIGEFRLERLYIYRASEMPLS